MDEFAQSREDDDLFADEFEPVSEPVAIAHESPAPVSEPARPTNTDVGEKAKAAKATGPGGSSKHIIRDQGQQDRRDRGPRSAIGSNGLQQSRYALQDDSSPATVLSPTPGSPKALPADTDPTSSDPQNPPPQPPTSLESKPGPPTISSIRTPAVRGDRSATGGPVHKKLTEEQLTAKLEKMAILNAQKAERHRLSEADQAAFQHQEKELAKERREKRVEEQKNSRQMEMERAKNRQRKMQAQGGREWDSEKVESDIVDGKGRARKSEYVRGNHGGVIRAKGTGLADSRHAVESDEPLGDAHNEGYSSTRGHGGFEIRGRGRRGRGGKSSGKSRTIPTLEDFPSLPTPTQPVSTTNAHTGEGAKSFAADKAPGEWADEMATPVEEKKMAI